MSYLPELEDCLSRSPMRARVTSTSRQFPPAAWDPGLPLARLLAAEPPCARDSYPDGWFDSHGADTQVYRLICRRCPVQQACLDYALADRELVGIWGGTTTAERQKMRQLRKAVPA